MYIGASLHDVRTAIRQEKMRFASIRDKRSGLIDVRGSGTTRFSDLLQKKLIKRWWDGGPGTKLVVGWVHSDGIRYDADPPNRIPPYRIVAVEVTRPYNRNQSRGMFDTSTLQGLFEDLLVEQMEHVDHRIRRVESDRRELHILNPEFLGDDGTKYGTSFFFVWPAGIIHDDRLSNLTNAMHAELHRRKVARQRVYDKKIRNTPYTGHNNYYHVDKGSSAARVRRAYYEPALRVRGFIDRKRYEIKQKTAMLQGLEKAGIPFPAQRKIMSHFS